MHTTTEKSVYNGCHGNTIIDRWFRSLFAQLVHLVPGVMAIKEFGLSHLWLLVCSFTMSHPL